MSEPPQRRTAPGRIELRRLRVRVFRLGGFVGLDTRAVLRFSEVISGCRCRRCGSADLELVVADFTHLANRLVVSARSDDGPDRQQGSGRFRR
jgi:hypothetical protein